MLRIPCPTPAVCQEPAPAWANLGLPLPWLGAVGILAPNGRPRPVQVEALGRRRILEKRRHLIVAAPTNAGKTLVGQLVLLEALRRGRSAVLLEPFRALVDERGEEFQVVRPLLEAVLGVPFRVRYRGGLPSALRPQATPEVGELLVATPERFDVLLRRPTFRETLKHVSAVVVDEAQLLAAPGRGPTLDYLLTTLLALPCPPRVVLLSATLGNTAAAEAWLDPCDVVRVTGRQPPLQAEVWALGQGEDADDLVADHAAQVLGRQSQQLLVFVYQTDAASRLAVRLQGRLGALAGPAGVLAYHARLAEARRGGVRSAYLAGESRCLVATTALAQGVNLPASHVVVRDVWFPGVGPLGAGALQQMVGRAGRGDQPGHAVVFVRPTDPVRPEEVVREVTEEDLPPLRSALALRTARPGRESAVPDGAAVMLARLGMFPEGESPERLATFFAGTLAGADGAVRAMDAVAWLTDPRRCLAYLDEGDDVRLTVLGRRAARAALPPVVAAGFARLLRDLLTLDPTDGRLAEWQPLDHLIVIELLHPSVTPCGLGTSAAEPTGEFPSLLWGAWLRDDGAAGPLLASLGLPARGAGRGGRRAVLRAIERLREAERSEEMGWLLSGLARLLEVRTFYHHLREHCGADRRRVLRVRGLLARMRGHAWDLVQALGPVRRRRPRPVDHGLPS